MKYIFVTVALFALSTLGLFSIVYGDEYEYLPPIGQYEYLPPVNNYENLPVAESEYEYLPAVTTGEFEYLPSVNNYENLPVAENQYEYLPPTDQYEYLPPVNNYENLPVAGNEYEYLPAIGGPNEFYNQGYTNHNPYYGGGSNYGYGSRSGPVVINNNYASAVSYGGGGRSATPSYYGGGSRTYAPYTSRSMGYSGGYNSGYSNQLTQGIRVVPSPNEGAPYTNGTVYSQYAPVYTSGNPYTDSHSMNTYPSRVYGDSYHMNTAPSQVYTTQSAWTTDYSEFYSRTKNAITNTVKRDPTVGLQQSEQLALSALPYTGIDDDPILRVILYMAFAGIVIAGAISLMIRHAENSFK